MIGMVLVTHGHLATEFRAALEHVVGPQKQFETISIGPDDDMERRRQDIIQAVHQVDAGQGVVILTDMFGGTPSNLAISGRYILRPEIFSILETQERGAGGEIQLTDAMIKLAQKQPFFASLNLILHFLKTIFFPFPILF